MNSANLHLTLRCQKCEKGNIYLIGLCSFLTVCQGLLSGLLQYSFSWSKAFLVSTTPCVMNSSSDRSLCSGLKKVLMIVVLALDLMLPGIAAQERRRRATRREAAWKRMDCSIGQQVHDFMLVAKEFVEFQELDIECWSATWW